MIYNKTTNGSVSETKNIEKSAKKYADMRSGSSSEGKEKTPSGTRVVVKGLAQIRVVNGKLQTVNK